MIRREDLFGAWLDRYPPGQQALQEKETLRREPEQSLQTLPIQARLDIHGLTRAVARNVVLRFFKECRSKGLRKVLVVHGKGLHSSGEAVLGDLVADLVEASADASRRQNAPARDGGSGASIVFLKG